MISKYQVVLLAGGFAPWLKPLAGTDIRCLAPLKGHPMLEYIVAALFQSGRISDILLVAPESALKQLEPVLPEGVSLCSAADSMPLTAAKALDALKAPDKQKVLFVCDDIPLLTSEAVNDFLNQCEAYPDKEAFYPIIRQETCQKAFPEGKRTYGKLNDGVFTGGNMMLLSAGMVRGNLQRGEEIFSMRKSPLKLCRWLGFGFILKLLLHLLDTNKVQERVSQLMGYPCQVIISPFPELGVDVDKPADWDLVKQYIKPL